MCLGRGRPAVHVGRGRTALFLGRRRPAVCVWAAGGQLCV